MPSAAEKASSTLAIISDVVLRQSPHRKLASPLSWACSCIHPPAVSLIDLETTKGHEAVPLSPGLYILEPRSHVQCGKFRGNQQGGERGASRRKFWVARMGVHDYTDNAW